MQLYALMFFKIEHIPQENKLLDFKLKKISERRDFFLEEEKQRKLMSKKQRKACMTLNYIDKQLL